MLLFTLPNYLVALTFDAFNPLLAVLEPVLKKEFAAIFPENSPAENEAPVSPHFTSPRMTAPQSQRGGENVTNAQSKRYHFNFP